ncbi:hypothetical protein QBC36DRAFT_300614 [Triangularia setosa]|uniref:HhH-GPD domain-containing protein n=1 Tax=Triangularia setosa TaxID=2587417 RepID=A0AAN7A955_9PEZI|nr:hypothetical protein QBC36DRAFT_300614 [Podospora setosa]
MKTLQSQLHRYRASLHKQTGKYTSDGKNEGLSASQLCGRWGSHIVLSFPLSDSLGLRLAISLTPRNIFRKPSLLLFVKEVLADQIVSVSTKVEPCTETSQRTQVSRQKSLNTFVFHSIAMQTREAARRAAQTAAVSEGAASQALQTVAESQVDTEAIAVDAWASHDGLVSSAQPEQEGLSTSPEPSASPDTIICPIVPGSKRKLGETSTEPLDTKVPAKHTRRAKKTAQLVKGEWVLPHGMGLATQSPAAIQNPAVTPRKAAPSKVAPKKAVPKTVTRQARISFRVSKASAQTKSDSEVDKSGQLEAIVRREEAIEAIPSITEEAVTAVEDTEKVAEELHITDQEEVSIGRVTRSRTAASTQSVIKYEQEVPDQALVITKKEDAIGAKTSTVVATRKLLIFKGVTLNGNLVSKSLEKILVDASQILDPDYRINVKRGTDNPYGLTPGYSPYPYRRVPTPEACEEVHRILTRMHGEVKQPDRIPAASLEVAGCGEVPCVLDALLRTLISGNTLMAMADAAIKKLGKDVGLRTEGTGAGSINWEKVRVSSHQALVNSIKMSGNGPKKAQHIKLILDKVYEENLEDMKQVGTPEKNEDGTIYDLLSLDYMHAMTKDQAMDKFMSFPGIGIKTAACVSLFCLRMPCFAVDTHVHKFCRWLGWTPVKADPDNVFRHGDFMVPDHLKYGLHQLFIRHGQTCFKCRKMTKPGSKDWNEAPDCPLEHLLDRSKDETKPPGLKKPRKAAKKVEDDENAGEDAVVVKGEELENSSADDEDEEQQGKERKDKNEDDDENEEDDEDGKSNEDDENNEEDDDDDDDANEKEENGDEDGNDNEKDDEASEVEMED